MNEINTHSTDRFAPLDGIRGIAIHLVLFYHLGYWSVNNAGIEYAGFNVFGRIFLLMTSYGWLGVDLFFVLSGFLITRILLNKKKHADYFIDFYSRRAMRILPLYFLVLILVLIFYKNSTTFVLLSALFMSNVSPLFGVKMSYVVLWSLAVEEHYYLIWPLIVRFLSFWNIVAFLCFVCLAEPFIRYLGFINNTHVYFYSWFRFDGLAMGGLLACLVFFFRTRHKAVEIFSVLSFSLGLLLLVVGMRYDIFNLRSPFGAAFCFSSVQLIFLSVISNSLTEKPALNKFLQCKLLVFTGKISYCLYLTHMLFMDLFDLVLSINDFSTSSYYLLSKAIFVLTMAYFFSFLSYRFFEGPLLRLRPKSFFEKRRNISFARLGL